MTRPVILCDVDEVVADLLGEWVRAYNVEYGDRLKADEITSWDLTEHVKPECGKDIYKFLGDRSIYNRVSRIPGALWGVEKLRELGRVVFVTSSNPATMAGKVAWLERHGFLDSDPRHSDLVIAHDKSLVRGDLLIDDGPHNVEAFPGPTILYHHAHNGHLDHPRRAHSWISVIHHAQEILRVRK